ncbi:hypothetical protein RT717_07345 [Imperialibacter roseus]|uniref:Lipoprotein n=1 Tax=Imperialibacter roseus TaxID=1324217 RepID=A0ABZ0IXR0_9BACT|nr:hypothetical protein [Imperialibacter roseus]WOK08451.1 hypothetical protein RT717_07345 [Imperialibacter roseus]
MKTHFLTMLLGALCTGCVSTGVLFQDGKTAGKKELEGAIGISYNVVPSYTPDTVSQTVALNPFKVPAPWINIQAQYGLAERLDVGGSFGFGLFSVGLHGFAKYALLPNDGVFHVSLYGGGGFAASTDKVENGTATFAQLVGGIPFSFDVTETNTLVIQPLYSHDFYKVKISGDTVYDDRFDAHLIHLGFGVIRKNLDKERAVFYNVTMNYSPVNKRAYPTFGVAIRP